MQNAATLAQDIAPSLPVVGAAPAARSCSRRITGPEPSKQARLLSGFLGRGFEDHTIHLGTDFCLADGQPLRHPVLTVRLQGRPGAPVIAVCGGISADRRVADSSGKTGWWRRIVHPGGAIDLTTFRVLSFEFLPGTAEAESPAAARTVTTRDQARALALALDALDIPALHSFVGSSYGGMIALAFAAACPERVGRLSVLCAADRAHPAATALRGIQRRIVAFAAAQGAPAEGLALARQLAMTTYRSPDEFAARFTPGPGAAPDQPSEVCSYLLARGEAFAKVTDPARFLTLSDSIDRHCITPAGIATPVLFIAARSDRLVPFSDVMRCAASTAGPSALLGLTTDKGHDAFLCDTDQFAPQLSAFLAARDPFTAIETHAKTTAGTEGVCP